MDSLILLELLFNAAAVVRSVVLLFLVMRHVLRIV